MICESSSSWLHDSSPDLLQFILCLTGNATVNLQKFTFNPLTLYLVHLVRKKSFEDQVLKNNQLPETLHILTDTFCENTRQIPQRILLPLCRGAATEATAAILQRSRLPLGWQLYFEGHRCPEASLRLFRDIIRV